MWVLYDKKKYPDMRVPIKVWCPEDYMGDALEQALHLAYHSVIFKQVDLMADAGYGYGMPIGCVIACDDAVIPNAVGKDIGCGMRFIRTNLKISDVSIETLEKIRQLIKQLVPVGFNSHENKLNNMLDFPYDAGPVTKQRADIIGYQLGTLGGGNHFIEIQVDEEDYVCFMIHSGSRNFGEKINRYHNKIAQKMNAKWHSKVDPKWDLAFLPIGSKEANDYIKDMDFAIKYAVENRRLIAELVIDAVLKYCHCMFFPNIDVKHNYVTIENHFGKNVWVHRKGAISAKKGQVGVIPGSMGSSSYITMGKGNKESFMSSSHGAGRVRSCTKSDEILVKEFCDQSMNGILFDGFQQNSAGKYKLSEAPGAYKDIDIVMNNQKDLVDIIHKLRPLGVVKELKEREYKK